MNSVPPGTGGRSSISVDPSLLPRMTPPIISSEPTADAPRAAHLASLLRSCDKTWTRSVLLLVLGAVVRFPALQGQFLWDDGFLAQANPFIKSPILIFETFRHNL